MDKPCLAPCTEISVSAPDGINSITLHGLWTPTCALTQPLAPLAGAGALCHGLGTWAGCAVAQQDSASTPALALGVTFGGQAVI